MNNKEIKKQIDEAGDQFWYHRFEAVKGSGVYTPGRMPADYPARLKLLGLRSDFFKGKRVLDVGTFTGALSFFLEECGAEVVAIDVFDPGYNGFNLVHELRNSNVRHMIASVYDLNPGDFGYFDVVAFFGVYYHLKHPVLAFERLNSICKDEGMLIGGGTNSDRWFHDDSDDLCQRGVDFHRINKDIIKNNKIISVQCLNDLPLTGFAAKKQYRDPTIWFVPNVQCVKGWLECCGFKVERVYHKAAPIVKKWNRNNILRSIMLFKAIKKGLPDEELPIEHVHTFPIPTFLELQQARKRIKELEERLKDYEREDAYKPNIQ